MVRWLWSSFLKHRTTHRHNYSYWITITVVMNSELNQSLISWLLEGPECMSPGNSCLGILMMLLGQTQFPHFLTKGICWGKGWSLFSICESVDPEHHLAGPCSIPSVSYELLQITVYMDFEPPFWQARNEFISAQSCAETVRQSSQKLCKRYYVVLSDL